MKVSSRPASFLGLSLATALTLLSFSLSSSLTSSISGVYALPVRSSQSLHPLPHSSSQPPSRKQHTQQVRRRSTDDTPAPSSKTRKTPSRPAQAKAQQHIQKKKSPSTTSTSNSTKNNKRQQQKQKQKQKPSVKAKAAAVAEEQRHEWKPAPAPVHPSPSSPRPPRSPLLSKKSTSPVSPPPSTSSATYEFDKPLLIIPSPRSVWHAGSVQLVKWSKNYARQLPKDTTVDIILADAKTNKKIFSLKRFIPFRKGSAQIWVPSKIPDNEDASYVLVLDLFHGKSQKPVTVDSAKASAATASAIASSSSSSSSSSKKDKPASTSGTSTTESNGTEAVAAVPGVITTAEATGGSANSKKSLPSILRRSDINIYKCAIPSPSSSSATTMSTSETTSSRRENHRIAAAAATTANASPADGARADGPPPPSQPYTGHHHIDDLPDDDTNDTSNQAASYYNNYDYDNFLRQEFPNAIHPIELEHSFGVHQKVYSRAPYTLEWKVPSRAAELLDYTATRLRLLANKDIDWSQHQSIKDNNITYQAKLLVELVRDGGPGQGEELDSVAVLARNVPVETKFQYLQIQDHVDPAFYRLRVQMLVVEVDDTLAGRKRSRKNEDPMLDGWDFAKGAQIIDRYESITRKFWVSAGAL